jgi:hypothetical protein
MRPLLLVLAIGIGLAGSASAVRAAPRLPARPIPVVATYFSNLSPKVGQTEMITAQFYLYQRSERPKYVTGAHLTVSLQLGKKVLQTVRGTATNKQGKAFARFAVPKIAGGKWLWAYTKLRYKGTLYGGSNRVKIART